MDHITFDWSYIGFFGTHSMHIFFSFFFCFTLVFRRNFDAMEPTSQTDSMTHYDAIAIARQTYRFSSWYQTIDLCWRCCVLLSELVDRKMILWGKPNSFMRILSMTIKLWTIKAVTTDHPNVKWNEQKHAARILITICIQATTMCNVQTV